MPARVELTLNQLAEALGKLTPDEFEKLLAVLDEQNLKARWETAKREVAEGKVVPEEELFEGLD